jgi:antitoxin HigA-1
MATKKIKSLSNLNALKEIHPDQIWNENKTNLVKEFILSESAKQTPERKLKNEMLAIKYKMRNYIEKNKVDHEIKIIDFVRMYLKILDLSQKEFATILGMKDTNLYKYLIGERKLNADIVLKLSAFSHTQPEIWYYIQTKNELLELGKVKGNLTKYKTFDYTNFVHFK